MPGFLLNENIIDQIKELFDNQLVYPVEILYFSKSDPGESSEHTYQLLKEVSAISDLISLSAYRLADHSQLAQRYRVSLAPGFVITARDGGELLNYGLNFAGIPSGYEFSSLIQAILLISKRDSGLKPEIRKELKSLTKPVSLKVFVTPT